MNKKRQYKLIECNSFDHKNIKVGWFWFYKQLISQKPKPKKLSIAEALSMSDTDIINKASEQTIKLTEHNTRWPKCAKCKVQYRRDNGCTCVVCHKFYCSRDATEFMDHRKSGIKCKACVGVTSNKNNNENTKATGFIKFKRNKTFG